LNNPADPAESDVLRDRAGGSADVAATELDRVHDERRDLVERYALLPARGEWICLGVGGKALLAESAEEPHHRKIELAVPAVRRGIDQPALTVDVDEPIAGPQVAVQPRGRFFRVEWFESTGEQFEVADRRRVECAPITRQPCERQEAIRRVE